MSGIGFGPALYASNCVTKDAKIHYDFLVVIGGSLFSILAAVVFSAYVGANSLQEADLGKLAGYELQFTVIGSMIGNLNSKSNIILFFVIAIAGLNALSLPICMTINFLMSQFISFKDNRILVATILMIIYVLIGLLFCTEEGLRILGIWEYYTMGVGPLFLVLSEIIIICWGFDLINLHGLLELRPGFFKHA